MLEEAAVIRFRRANTSILGQCVQYRAVRHGGMFMFVSACAVPNAQYLALASALCRPLWRDRRDHKAPLTKEHLTGRPGTTDRRHFSVDTSEHAAPRSVDAQLSTPKRERSNCFQPPRVLPRAGPACSSVVQSRLYICRHRLAVVRTHRAWHACPQSAELLLRARHPPWTGQGERAVRNPAGAYIKPLDEAR
jgi:hypothetical protein